MYAGCDAEARWHGKSQRDRLVRSFWGISLTNGAQRRGLRHPPFIAGFLLDGCGFGKVNRVPGVRAKSDRLRRAAQDSMRKAGKQEQEISFLDSCFPHSDPFASLDCEARSVAEENLVCGSGPDIWCGGMCSQRFF